MVIENADRKPIDDIAREVIERAPGVRAADLALMKTLDRWGFLVPLSILRRMLLRALFRNFHFRRKGSGTFQLTVLPDADQASSPVFSASALLLVGGVREKAAVYRGNLAVRAMVTLTCCADHRVWDGRAGQRFLTSVREILESDGFLVEIQSCRPDSLAKRTSA
jgi:pyruvate/2-oxoglutarate dehydrogenase complex dihydrolipoamide acyltransferase (E2) component